MGGVFCKISNEKKSPRCFVVDGTWTGGEGCSCGTRLAGLTLLGRVLRQLHLIGAEDVTVYGGDPGKSPDVHEKHLERGLKEAPKDLRVELALKSIGPEKTAGALSGCGFYELEALGKWASNRGGEPPPCMIPDDSEKLKKAEKNLWGQAGKSVAHDGLVAYYVGRPVGRLFSKILVDFPVTPNMVTVASMVIGVAGGIAASTGKYSGFVAGAFLYWFGMVVDCVDGDLARVKLCGSRLGQWLDTIADDISTCAITVGFSIGLYVQTGYSWILWVGILGGFSVVFTAGYLYHGLAVMRLPADTACYPWFFLGKGGVLDEKGATKGRYGWLTYLVRRDFSSSVYFLLSLLGLAWASFIMMAAGAGVYACLSLVDMAAGKKTRTSRRGKNTITGAHDETDFR